MFKFNEVIVFCCVILNILSEPSIDSSCILESSGFLGKCKLLSDCSVARDDILLHHILPQICGFQETQSIVCCPPDDIKRKNPDAVSAAKCREYSQYAYKKPSGEFGSKNDCGHKIVKRIVGGVPVSRTEFAHMAIIGYEIRPREVEWTCGGTIISEQYILTAAHCRSRYGRNEAKYVKVGITSLSKDEHKQVFRVAKFISHPSYQPPSLYNDIALIKLNTPVTLHSHARPACLYREETIPEEKPIATGWGYTSFGDSGISDQLRKVTVDFANYHFCNSKFKETNERQLKYGISSDSQICAGTGMELKDICRGDAGGPLQIYHTFDDIECMYDIVGVTSFGKDCSGGPAVYTKVAHYIKWIEDIVWPE